MASEQELRKAICEVGQRLWARSQVAATDGNISARMADGNILCTPTGVSKGFMAPDQIVMMTPDGRVIGPGEASSEAMLHLVCYCARRDVGAVVHAHPPYATAFAALGRPLPTHYITEVAVTLWEVPCARFAPPGSPEVPETALPMLQQADAFLLRNHGVVAVGRDIWEAHHRMEWVEQGAQVAAVIQQLGGADALSAERLRELQAIRDELGLGVDPADYRPEGCIERISAGWGGRDKDQ